MNQEKYTILPGLGPPVLLSLLFVVPGSHGTPSRQQSLIGPEIVVAYELQYGFVATLCLLARHW